MTRGKRLDEIREELIEIANKEANYLHRLAWSAARHGCSKELIREIRQEAYWCRSTATVYPDRLVYWKTTYELKYAFKIR